MKSWFQICHFSNTYTINIKYTFPESTMYFIPGIVREVSATFVATTHSLAPSGGSWKTYKRENRCRCKSMYYLILRILFRLTFGQSFWNKLTLYIVLLQYSEHQSLRGITINNIQLTENNLKLQLLAYYIIFGIF